MATTRLADFNLASLASAGVAHQAIRTGVREELFGRVVLRQPNQREFCGFLVGAVGIEPSCPLNQRKLFIPRNATTDTNARNAELRYTAGTPHRLFVLSVYACFDEMGGVDHVARTLSSLYVSIL
jgi:hypothetical protein